VTSPLDLAYRNTSLEPGARRHLERLTASWSLLADLCFSDLLLYVPFDPLASGASEADDERLVVLGQVRPTTSQTLFEIDLVGEIVASRELPLVVEALRTGAISVGEQRGDGGEGHLRLECIPVRYSAQVLGAMTRVWSPSIARRRGALERVYLDVFERISGMVTDGVFPFPEDDELPVELLPRVGDGTMVLDDRSRITFASPNAVSALHRIGIMSAINGSTFPALGLDTTLVQDAFATRLPVVEEIERRSEVILLLRCIPLLARGEVTGAFVLMRDVTDVRSRDRLLLTKDATIREVHHRVKNNLQTISSLLRLQARRIDAPAARTALSEAERRIRSIAVVHEILSRDAGDQVPFDEIVAALVRMAQEANIGTEDVAVRVEGELGDIPADMATPLAVVVAELLQNAIEHAFASENEADRLPTPSPRIDLEFGHGADALVVVVHDNGRGLPPGFDIDQTKSLGLSIVRDLVRTQLGGSISMTNEDGTLVRLELLLPRGGGAR
jgi:two-component sensor histidine kinase